MKNNTKNCALINEMGFLIRVPHVGSRVPDDGFQVEGSKFWIPGKGPWSQVPGEGYQVEVTSCRVPDPGSHLWILSPSPSSWVLLFQYASKSTCQNTDQKEGCAFNLYIVRNEEFQFIWQKLYSRECQMPYSTWGKLT